jgi:FdhD protein
VKPTDSAPLERAPDDATAPFPVRKLKEGSRDAAVVDRVAVEAPLELRFGEGAATVLMRTPGDDEDLVRGFLFSEGIVRAASDVRSIARPAGLSDAERGNVIAVDVAASRPLPGSDRTFYSSSSCGVCGKNSLGALAISAARITSDVRVRRAVLCALPAAMRSAQPTFAVTGGLHASALFDVDGTLLAVREDVGRHNALDKLVGWALDHGAIPLDRRVLLVSGRVSYEIVQKAIVAGVPIVAAVGAPSSYAIGLAEEFGVTLAGFVRPDALNVYSHRERVLD